MKTRSLIPLLFLLCGGVALATAIIPVYSGSWVTQSGGVIIDTNETPGTCAVWKSPSAYSGAQLAQSPCPSASPAFSLYDNGSFGSTSVTDSTATLYSGSVTTGTSDGPTGAWLVTITMSPARYGSTGSSGANYDCISTTAAGTNGTGSGSSIVSSQCGNDNDRAFGLLNVADTKDVPGPTIVYSAQYANSTTVDFACEGYSSATGANTIYAGACNAVAVPI